MEPPYSLEHQPPGKQDDRQCNEGSYQQRSERADSTIMQGASCTGFTDSPAETGSDGEKYGFHVRQCRMKAREAHPEAKGRSARILE